MWLLDLLGWGWVGCCYGSYLKMYCYWHGILENDLREAWVLEDRCFFWAGFEFRMIFEEAFWTFQIPDHSMGVAHCS